MAWQGNSIGVAWEWHAMCESALRGTKFIKHETINTFSFLLQCHVIIYAKTNTQYIKNNIKHTYTCLEFTIQQMNTICNLNTPFPLSKGLSCILLNKIQL